MNYELMWLKKRSYCLVWIAALLDEPLGRGSGVKGDDRSSSPWLASAKLLPPSSLRRMPWSVATKTRRGSKGSKATDLAAWRESLRQVAPASGDRRRPESVPTNKASAPRGGRATM